MATPEMSGECQINLIGALSLLLLSSAVLVKSILTASTQTHPDNFFFLLLKLSILASKDVKTKKTPYSSNTCFLTHNSSKILLVNEKGRSPQLVHFFSRPLRGRMGLFATVPAFSNQHSISKRETKASLRGRSKNTVNSAYFLQRSNYISPSGGFWEIT